MSQPTPEDCLKLVSAATEPGVKLTRADCVNVNNALLILEAALKELAEFKKPKAAPSP
jgi:hypothetical protein